MQSRNIFLSLALFFGVVFAPVAPARACTIAQPESASPAKVETRIETDRWYELWIDGSRAGWSHEVVSVEGDTIVTRSTMRMEIGRADQTVEISMESEFVETLAGVPVEMRIEQRLGPTPIRTVYRFKEDGVEVIWTQNGVEREDTRPTPEGVWLPPAAASRYVKQRLASGATKITVRTLDPSNGLTVSAITRSGITPSEVEVAGKITECLRATTRTVVGATQMTGTEWLLADGTPLRSELAIGSMNMVTLASSRQRAMENFTPPELMVSTFVRPDRRITNPRHKTRAVYRVRLSGDGELPELPQSGFQRAEALDDGSTRVTIDTRTVILAPEADRAAHLVSTTYANADDALIVELTERALAGAGDDPTRAAELLRRFVFDHIADKDLGTAFATASEVARSGQGDCSEHGVLLAAMLRAADIPSRVAIGVVYVERFAGERHVFGYHMWTQALLETANGPAWIDLDATLDRRTSFDATHIAMATSDLAEGKTISQLASIAPLLGALEIIIEETR
ncbi:MAG: transglutaminase-like domain-containing protein [Planctomycetota bacterium]|nr:transglutaminase-like domain-containing protein [Planctomycetota bacterium]